MYNTYFLFGYSDIGINLASNGKMSTFLACRLLGGTPKPSRLLHFRVVVKPASLAAFLIRKDHSETTKPTKRFTINTNSLTRKSKKRFMKNTPSKSNFAKLLNNTLQQL